VILRLLSSNRSISRANDTRSLDHKNAFSFNGNSGMSESEKY
jgi:hypothetical protein